MRLIDADALISELNNSHYPGAPYVDAGISIAIGKVCDAPTIEPDPDTVSRQQAIDAMGKATWAINRINELPPSPGRLFEHSKQNDDFEKQIHAMFDHIWDCEIEHPVFQDTVGDLMTAFIKCHADMRGGAV